MVKNKPNISEVVQNMKNIIISLILFVVLAPYSYAADSTNKVASDNQNSALSDAGKTNRSLVIHKKIKEIKIYRKRGELLVEYRSVPDKINLFVKNSLSRKSFKSHKKVSPSTFLLSFDEDKVLYDDFKSGLLEDANVTRVEANIKFKTHSSKDLSVNQWHIKRIRKFHKKNKKFVSSPRFAKSGVKIGIVDTGVDSSHEDLVGNVVPGINVISENTITDTMDDNGHGTKVAGVIAALDNGIGVVGVNPNATIVAIKAFDNSGVGYLSDIIEGIDWAINNEVTILNLSFGTYENSELLHNAINRAVNAGLILVAAAGNDSNKDITYPAGYANVIGVGSVDMGGWISDFSNWGDGITFFAPGNQILTTNYTKNGFDKYFPFSGTSASAAYVSGVLSLLVEQGVNPKVAVSMLNANSIMLVSPKHPRKTAYASLNQDLIFSELNKERLEKLSITRFETDVVTNEYNGNYQISLSVQNTGNVTSKQQEISLITEEFGYHQILIKNILPSLRPGERFDNTFTVSGQELTKTGFTQTKNIKEVNVALETSVNKLDGSNLRNKLPLFLSKQPFSALDIITMWVTPVDFNDVASNKTLNIYMRNVGTTPLNNVEVKSYTIPATHEGVGKVDKTLFNTSVVKQVLLPGQSITLQIPLLKHPVPSNEVTFLSEVVYKNKLIERSMKSYVQPKEMESPKLQYAQNVHRWLVYEALRYLENKGITIPDLQETSPLRGNPSSANNWPEILYLPTTEISVSGYWTDDVLDFISASVGGLNYSLIDGSHDADGVDIAYNYSFEDNFDSHFWFVDNHDDDGLNNHCLLPNEENHHSALWKLRALMHGGWGSANLQHGAIDHYKNGYKKAAWWFVGHAAHLIGDLSLPSHTLEECNAHGVYGATYHGWMDNGGYLSYSYQDAIAQGDIIDPYDAQVEGEPVRFLAYSTAQLGSSFPWASTVSATYFGTDGNRAVGGEAPYYSQYMSSIMSNLSSRPLYQWHVNKDETYDSFEGCDLEDWLATWDERRDCWDGDGHIDYDNSDVGGNNDDGDMASIGSYNYPYAIRATASLIYYFAVESGQIMKQGDVSWLIPIINNLLLN